jgi:glycogen phosphorylase
VVAPLPPRVAVDLAGLEPQDVDVEVIMRRTLPAGSYETPLYSSYGPRPAIGRDSLRFTGDSVPQGHVFALDAMPPWSGQLALQIRVLPTHELLSHPYEMGLLKWL